MPARLVGGEAMMGEVGSAYGGVRQRITALVGPADPDLVVPGCPQWSLKDVVAHVTGVVDDALAGRLDGVGTDPWTEAQVMSRRDRSLADVLGEWNEKAPVFEGVLDGVGPSGRQAVFDVTTHEHDLRGALQRPGARDSDAVHIGLSWLAPAFLVGVAAAGLPPLRLRTDGGEEWLSGDGPTASGGPGVPPGTAPGVVTTVTGPAFELLRSLGGRRSLAQLRALDWAGDPEPYLSAFEFGPFRTPAHDVVE